MQISFLWARAAAKDDDGELDHHHNKGEPGIEKGFFPGWSNGRLSFCLFFKVSRLLLSALLSGMEYWLPVDTLTESTSSLGSMGWLHELATWTADF